MVASIDLWLEYLLRFSHLVAGIAWIGSSFYFIWLDSSFEAPEVPRRNVDGELFMVHGGFYYQVEKRKIYPGELPKILHWFKWEATLTWITGFTLFVVLYWMRGASLLIDHQVSSMSQGRAVLLSLGILVASWLIYDYVVWNANLIRSKAVSVFLSIFFFGGLIYFLTKTFSGRGAFIMTGAILGSMMLLNVWVRILPGQSKMLREARAGRVPDYSVSLKSKTRSVHNTYFTFPVLFIMLSNHYPQVYNHPRNWLLLIVLAVSGALTRHAMVTKRPVERWTLFPAAMGLGALVWMTAAIGAGTAGAGSAAADPGAPPVSYEQVHLLAVKHCYGCHSSAPTDEFYKTAPNGIKFENEHDLRARADKILLHVVQAKSMPLGNKTGMTDEERTVFARWLQQK